LTNTIEHAAALHIGTVETVAPDSIAVRLDGEAPQTTAINTGVPSPFPRINGYVLIPKETGALVGLVVWLGIDRAPQPKVRGGAGAPAPLIDLPYPQRRMVIAPVGTLRFGRGDEGFEMQRGIAAFPSVGDEVLLPTRQQLRAIVEPTGVNDRVHLGDAVLAAGTRVAFDPDKLFGRHVAVLGNTGSGKSCTVAGLVRWSLQAAARVRGGVPNARFIVLDPNGEYGRAFADVPGGARVFRAPPGGHGEGALQVPAWLWNGHEWSAFAAASARVQRPVLMRALRELRSGTAAARNANEAAWSRLSLYLQRLTVMKARGPAGLGDFKGRQEVGACLRQLVTDATSLTSRVSAAHQATLLGVVQSATQLRDSKWDGKYFTEFAVVELETVLAFVSGALAVLPAPPSLGVESEDAPIAFDAGHLADHLEMLSQDDGMGQAASFISSLVLRVRTMLADQRMRPIIEPDRAMSFEEWLGEYIGADGASNGAVAVVDLSLVPSDVVHVVVAVLARVVFEATQRYRRMNNAELPTVLVLEEAHTFVRRFDAEDGDTPSPTQMCRLTFERIAREGRKFGLGLLLSSQRPAELSPTVLAQCNTFILHRLVNDRDQELVQRLVPDNLSGLLKELPTLPTRHAIVLGWAVSLPVLTHVRELAIEHRPSSSDPEFWATWTAKSARPIDWSAIAAEWTGVSGPCDAEPSGDDGDGPPWDDDEPNDDEPPDDDEPPPDGDF
jgi:hypothetical protein